jgi:glutathione peroxidase
MLSRIIVTFGLALFAIALIAPATLAGPKDDNAKSKDKQKGSGSKSQKEANGKTPALAFTMKDIDGKEQDLRQYAGKVVLMVNVASRCGFTKQYKGLEALYQKYRDKGLVVLGFPANDFGKQEPGTNEEIKSFCTGKYKVTFPMFAKVSVKGADTCPLYKHLSSKSGGNKKGSAVTWNFNKFLVSRQGEVIAHFDSRVTPEDEKLVKAIEKALAQGSSEPGRTSQKP